MRGRRERPAIAPAAAVEIATQIGRSVVERGFPNEIVAGRFGFDESLRERGTGGLLAGGEVGGGFGTGVNGLAAKASGPPGCRRG